MAAIGTDFAATVAAGGVVGYLIDRWRASHPWGLLVGLILGILVAFVRFTRDALALTRADVRRYRDAHPPKPDPPRPPSRPPPRQPPQ